MKKLLHKIMLDCKEATRLISIKSFQRLSFKQGIQLSLHLMACKFCKQFKLFNDIVDDSIHNVCAAPHVKDQKLSPRKKAEFSALIEKELK